jgi:glutathione synthase/RimK-type ligase-like ATP-grasp enzyme
MCGLQCCVMAKRARKNLQHRFSMFAEESVFLQQTFFATDYRRDERICLNKGVVLCE